MTMITGLFRDHDGAERASRAVAALGYDSSDITVIMSDAARQRYVAASKPTVADSDTQEKTAAGDKLVSNKLGGPMGGNLGILASVVAAVGVLLIPGLGVIAGPLAVSLAAAGAVGLAGGIVGILTKWGIPSSRVKEYEDGILAGGILLGVKAKSEVDVAKIQQRWLEQGGEYVHS